MKKITASLILLALNAGAISLAHASVVVGGTRMVFEGNSDESSINVTNKDNKADLVQSWLSVVDPACTDTNALVVTPPLFRLDAGQKNSIRVIKTGAPLPEDKESMYWLNVKGIPSTDPNAQKNQVEIAINTQIKLIYRPKSLLGKSPDSVTTSLKWSASGDELTVTNPTPYYMNFALVKVDGEEVKNASFVAPNSKMNFKLPHAVSHGNISWRIISDYGMALEEHNEKI